MMFKAHDFRRRMMKKWERDNVEVTADGKEKKKIYDPMCNFFFFFFFFGGGGGGRGWFDYTTYIFPF